MTYKWNCPLCIGPLGQFERHTEFGLVVATANHIAIHMDEARLQAVQRARIQCTNSDCHIGMAKVFDPNSGLQVPKLSDYDRKLLEGMKIKID